MDKTIIFCIDMCAKSRFGKFLKHWSSLELLGVLLIPYDFNGFPQEPKVYPVSFDFPVWVKRKC